MVQLKYLGAGGLIVVSFCAGNLADCRENERCLFFFTFTVILKKACPF